MQKTKNIMFRGVPLTLELDTDPARPTVSVSCKVAPYIVKENVILYVGGEWKDTRENIFPTLVDAIKHVCHDWPPIVRGNDLVDQFNCLPEHII